jgi:cytochrome c peroxidase
MRVEGRILPGALLAALGAMACGSQGSTSTQAATSSAAVLRAQLVGFSPSATDLPAPPADATNRFADNPAAAFLGQKIFFDNGFAGGLIDGDNDGTVNALGNAGQTGRVSCAGCHVASAGFLDNRSLGQSGTPTNPQTQASLAAGWTLRRTPSLLDTAQSSLFSWNGRRDSTWMQFFGPLEADNEMNSSRLYLAEYLFANYRNDYQEIFGVMPAFDDASRFPQLTAAQTGCTLLPGKAPVCHGQPGDGAEFDNLSAADQDAVTRAVANAGKAVGAYLRKLSCGTSRMDAFVHGDDKALTASEQRGAAIFAGKGNCTSCHSGPFLSDEKFHNVGLHPVTVSVVVTDSNDQGAATGIPDLLADALNSRGEYSDGDDGRLDLAASQQVAGGFRTPRLRCVSQRPSFMHTGQLRSLEQAVAFFDQGGHLGGYPGTNELKPLGLTDADRTDLAAFLRALDGSGPPSALQGTP